MLSTRTLTGVMAMPEHTHGPDCNGVEMQGIYDGILYWICDGVATPRSTDPNTRLGQLSAQFADAFNAGADREAS